MHFWPFQHRRSQNATVTTQPDDEAWREALPRADDKPPDYRPGRALHFKFLRALPEGFKMPVQRKVVCMGRTTLRVSKTRLLVSVLGSDGVGKRSLVNQLYWGNINQASGEAGPPIKFTIEGDIYIVEFSSPDLYQGQGGLSGYADMFDRTATIVTYAVTSATSFAHARALLESSSSVTRRRPPSSGGAASTSVSRPFPILLLGLCIDEPNRQVPRSAGERLALEHGCKFSEASSLKALGTVAALGRVAESTYQRERRDTQGKTEEEKNQIRAKFRRIWTQWMLSLSPS